MNKQSGIQEKELLSLMERFAFRNIEQSEAGQAAEIERICFPPNEACSDTSIRERIAAASELFLVAVDKQKGKIAGFLNGIATNEDAFRDEFFTDVRLYNPQGKNIMHRRRMLFIMPHGKRQRKQRSLVPLPLIRTVGRL